MGHLHFSSRASSSSSAWILIQAKARQIPLSTTEHISWDFFEKPSPDSTSHLIFDTVSSFLQHWPNTRYRNGHNIVPGTIPIGTLLYHGTFREEIPRIPEWTATDPEHSYLFCVPTSEHSGCWHLTLVATRPLKVLYFDGSSAAKFPGGAMDSQDVLAWGEVKPDWKYEERKRIIDLYGFVSEVMVCDFAAGLEVVSFHYLVPGEGPRGHKRPSVIKTNDRLPTDFRVIEAGSWHNHFPGETPLFPKRWEHRLKGPEDVETLWKTMGSILQGAWDRPVRSGIDWKTFLRVIVDRYTGRLRVLNHFLNSTMLESEEDITLALNKAHGLMSGMLSPYRIYSASPPEVHYDSIPKFSWAIPVFIECATTHTRYIDSLSHTLTYSEHLLLNSTKGVSKEICRVIVGMWAEGMEHTASKGGFTRSAQELVTRWKELTEELMTWLDWSEWVTCQPACGDEEICYLPTWPFFTGGPGYKPPRSRSRFRHFDWSLRRSMPDDGPDDSIKPQPRCIRRIELVPLEGF
ncbi:hypothetical protein BYT27DRAFT_7181762 [Phlegmacium glaucopus]|nr:hypothetical protein BYT27DRAFT_7181762 [Phlegmacium glaucopus]